MKTLRIFGREIATFGAVENKARNKTQAADLLKKIKKSQLVRTREDVKKWRDALSLAESELNPDRTALIRLFKDIALDAHLSSLCETLKLKVTGSPFFIENAAGDIDDELSKAFRVKWFRDLVGFIVEARFWGYSLVQFGDIRSGTFTSVELVPREYVIPEKRAVKSDLHVTMSGLNYFDERPFDLWTLFIHEPGDMGLFTKAAPLAIWKKNVLGAWSEAAELFGMPVRLGKTDINDPAAYANMTKMLEEMGSAAWGVFDNDDTIELIEITKSDYYNVYDKLIDRANSEMSKLILGQTMSSDNGSSRSQAEVHERVLDDYVNALKTYVADVVNNSLFPLMLRHGILTPGARYRHDNEEKIDIKTRFDMVDKLVKSNKYEIEPEYIVETFGIPVEKKEPAPVPPGLNPRSPQPGNEEDELDEDGNPIEKVDNSIMPTVSALYEKAKHVH